LNVSASKIRGLLRLMGEGQELALDAAAAEQHLLRGVLDLVGGVAILLVEVFDYRPGGAANVRREGSIGFDEVLRRSVEDQYIRRGNSDPAVLSLLEQHAKVPRTRDIVRRRSELIGDGDWYDSPYFAEIRRPARVDDGIYTGRLLRRPHHAEAIGLYRAAGDSPFTEEECQIVGLFHSEVLPKFRRPGQDAAGVELSPRLRETLAALLRGTRRKQIAADMGISVHTVNEYVKALYHQLGVAGQPELMARYGRRPRGRSEED
jgi:DNA-binding CsgD family transcriptional regulator